LEYVTETCYDWTGRIHADKMENLST
jgi:hypothetical protein